MTTACTHVISCRSAPSKSSPSCRSSASTHREVYTFTGALSSLPIASVASVLRCLCNYYHEVYRLDDMQLAQVQECT